MPISSYINLHHEAELNEQEKMLIKEWSTNFRDSINQILKLDEKNK